MSAPSGLQKRKYQRFQVGAFMTLQKQKREQAVIESDKIHLADLKIIEKKKELQAKERKLQRLETKVL